ncbi:MAG: hypothetical protein KDC98_00045 [Planctomycetes bacterium]|nr:hypothetical protein [Planctomycetota bacterium]
MNHDDELDCRLDEQLRAAFAPPPRERLRALATGAVRPRRGPAPWPVWMLLTAAACMLTWVSARSLESVSKPEEAPLGSMWAAAYEDAVQRGLANCCPGGCGGGFDLAQACRQRFDAQLRMAGDANVELLGAYEGLPTGECMALLAAAGGAPVCLFVLPRAEDRRVELPSGKPFHLSRREVGDLILYAVSESPGSTALDEFVLP